MPETPSDAFVRTTLVHEDKKADLLLPSNLPVAELLPSIARRFLTVTPRRAIQGFVLTMSNGATIDPGLTFAAQGVKNGTLLILGPRVRETEKKYDDVIEAVADVVNESNKPWTESDAAGVASGAAATLLVAATLLLSQARPTAGVVVPVILGCLAALLFGIVWVLSEANAIRTPSPWAWSHAYSWPPAAGRVRRTAASRSPWHWRASGPPSARPSPCRCCRSGRR